MEAAMPTGLERELEVFEKNRGALLGTAKGKFALVKGDQVVDVFESLQDALKRGYELFGNNPFLVKQVLEVDVPANFTSFQIGV
ncbi:MAG TPA: hypothetical protein VFF02_02610 [Anaeromyxobacteraceae bacterium]|nr:hypothetical protein [Anaeromyxobacteraceae bacterium]